MSVSLRKWALLFGFFWLVCTPLRAVGGYWVDNSLGQQIDQGYEALNKHRDKEAFEHFKKADADDNVLGTAFLGVCYLEGRGTKVDYYLAKTYFDSVWRRLEAWRKRKGNVESLAAGELNKVRASVAYMLTDYGLATMAQKGLGVPKDPKKALKMYRQIIIELGANGMATFLNHGGLGIDPISNLIVGSAFKHAINLKLLQVTKFNKNMVAKEYTGKTLYQIGMAYKMGIGTGKKRGKAKKFLEKAVEFGNEEAMQALEGLE
ncbi:hypothetical protein HHE06_01300 [Helicobacter heilmannii]|uniref:tetratricopeptide repeat protein n=1 Tax=Helicobacter heilmannii TaxID=35817 RepID=UPI0006A1C0AE|nr:SEL1-like repeat protein [Helicobacter heilmannii]CRF50307.1 hypothetical protein HHE06_01300 [Helicobacter heilmannii]